MDPVTINTIRQAVRELGLAHQAVCLHASFRSFGAVEGGPETLVQGFLQEGCTVLVPTFTDEFLIPPPPNLRPERNGWNYAVNYGHREGLKRTYTPASKSINAEEMGAVPKWVVEQPGRIRGNHPICSFAALGPRAEALAGGQSPADVFAPLKVLSQMNGRVVLIGVGLDSMTLLHLAEENAGRSMFLRWANGPDGKPATARCGGCSNGFRRFEGLLAPFVRSTTVGRSTWKTYPAPAILRTAAEAIKQDPAITVCGNPACERCPDAVLGGPIWKD
ncbi:MAG TPA: AAC(3) family N-acetyltransferase [Planctomycetota bacterium]|nr:AAC(3) family N-acetyltransferase [Planctomycetota bacterium]